MLRSYCAKINRNYDEIGKLYFSYSAGIFDDAEEMEQKMRARYEISVHKNTMSYETFQETMTATCILGTKESCLKRIQDYVDIGVDHFVFSIVDPLKDKESLRFFATL